MLVSLSFSIWDAWSYDEPEGAKVAKRNHVDEGTVKVRKELFPFEAPEYEAIPRAYRRLKAFNDKNTLKWARGVNILAASNFQNYVTNIKPLMADFDKAVREFLAKYETLKKKAKTELNGLYKEEDWPELNDLKRRFGCYLFFFKVPSAGDFRVELQGEALKSVREQIEIDVSKKSAEAMSQLYAMVKEAVDKITAAFKEDKVKQPLFDRLHKLCDEDIPRLNVGANKDLIKFAESVKAGLGSVQAKEVREDKDLHKKVEAEAKELSKQIAQWV